MNKILLEIRQGIGGEESLFFVKDLFKMYTKFFNKNNISYSIIQNYNFKEIILEIENNKFYNNLIKESGVHRVQRIPKNENQGKMHTSTCSVFFIENNNFKIENINFKDLKIETCKSGGAGGQHVNTTNSSVKITHLPTKISIEYNNERSQILNKNKALILLNLKIIKIKENEYFHSLNSKRKLIISNSDRSKKIRTYNYLNNKIIDHIKNKNYFQLNKILNGNLEILFNN